MLRPRGRSKKQMKKWLAPFLSTIEPMENIMKSILAFVAACLLTAALTVSSSAGTGKAYPMKRNNAMTLDNAKSLARRSLQMWDSNNTDKPEAVFAADYVNHQESAAVGGVKDLDLDGWKAVVEDNHRAFSDFKVRILMQIAEGDLVATRWQFSATQTGPYLGHPPTGKRATWTGVQIDRVENGKIVESWVDWDKFRLFTDLGFFK
jgi:predicted ester cyclase